MHPSIDLGFAPYTGDTPLASKLYWRYFGFYFDHKLSFKEHIQYYTTKALTVVRALGMPGNSSRGVLVIVAHKCLLHQMCGSSGHLWSMPLVPEGHTPQRHHQTILCGPAHCGVVDRDLHGFSNPRGFMGMGPMGTGTGQQIDTRNPLPTHH